jgi:hypothetical protein
MRSRDWIDVRRARLIGELELRQAFFYRLLSWMKMTRWCMDSPVINEVAVAANVSDDQCVASGAAGSAEHVGFTGAQSCTSPCPEPTFWHDAV